VKISYLESQTIKREKLENKMIFLGLLIVQNQLKPQTAETIAILNKANIRLAMATGDYILTAISVARHCELINPESTVYNCEIIDNKLVWNHIEKFDDNDFIDENEIEEGKEFRLDTEEEEIMLGINKSYTVAKKMNFTFDKEKLEKKIKKEIKNREEKNKIEEQKEEEKKEEEKNVIEKNGIENKGEKNEEEKKEEENSTDNSLEIGKVKKKITSPSLAARALKDITIQNTNENQIKSNNNNNSIDQNDFEEVEESDKKDEKKEEEKKEEEKKDEKKEEEKKDEKKEKKNQ
jgi:hypothetical protein